MHTPNMQQEDSDTSSDDMEHALEWNRQSDSGLQQDSSSQATPPPTDREELLVALGKKLLSEKLA